MGLVRWYALLVILLFLLWPESQAARQRADRRRCFAYQARISTAIDRFDRQRRCQLREHRLHGDLADELRRPAETPWTCQHSHAWSFPAEACAGADPVQSVLEQHGYLFRSDAPGFCYYGIVPFGNGVYCYTHRSPASFAGGAQNGGRLVDDALVVAGVVLAILVPLLTPIVGFRLLRTAIGAPGRTLHWCAVLTALHFILSPNYPAARERANRRACFANQARISAAIDSFDQHRHCRLREHFLHSDGLNQLSVPHDGSWNCPHPHSWAGPDAEYALIGGLLDLLEKNGESPFCPSNFAPLTELYDPGQGPNTAYNYRIVPSGNGVSCDVHGSPGGAPKRLRGHERPQDESVIGSRVILVLLIVLVAAVVPLKIPVPPNPAAATEPAANPIEQPHREPRPRSPLPLAAAAQSGLCCAVCGSADGPSRWLSCPACEAAHHAECWEFQEGCAIYGCSLAHGRWRGD